MENNIEVYVAGNSDNKGNAGTGVIVCDNEKVLIKYCDFVPGATNYEIEYHAFLSAVDILSRFNLCERKIIFKSHHQQTVNSLRLEENVKKADLLALRNEVFKELASLKDFEIEFGTSRDAEFLCFEARHGSSSKLVYADKTLDEDFKELPFSARQNLNQKSDTRPSWDEYFMKAAILAAERSSCLRRHVGAVIVKDNRQLTTGYNGAAQSMETCIEKGYCMRNKENVPSGTRLEYCHALHAEMNAIIQASKIGISIEGATIYITHFPCSLCTKMLIGNGIKRIVYREGYPDDFAKELLKETNIVVDQLS